MSEVTLVFPATHPAGIDYVLEARERGEMVVAASSQWDPDAIAELGEILHLPYINDESFHVVFESLKQEFGITRVYAPAVAVFTWFKKQIAEQMVTTSLVGWSPVAREALRVRKLMEISARYKPFITHCSEVPDTLSSVEIAANFRMASQIFGESNNDKIAAIMAVFGTAPQGDVVEIGSLAGKSASILNAMAKKFRTGCVLAIDPWMSTASEQLDSPSSLRVDVAGVWEACRPHRPPRPHRVQPHPPDPRLLHRHPPKSNPHRQRHRQRRQPPHRPHRPRPVDHPRR